MWQPEDDEIEKLRMYRELRYYGFTPAQRSRWANTSVTTWPLH